MNSTYTDGESRRIDIDADQAISVQVTYGTLVHCAHGRVWLTQQCDPRDHCFAAGLTFCVDKPGRAVISALDGPCVIVVRKPAPRAATAYLPGTLRIESLERLTFAARHARSEHVRESIDRVFRWPLKGLGRLRQAVRTAWRCAMRCLAA